MGSLPGRQMVPLPLIIPSYNTLLSPPWELRIDEYFMKTSMSPITSNSSLHQVLLAPIKTSISPVSVYSLVLVKLKQQLAAESGQLCREDLGQISSHPPWIIYTSPLHWYSVYSIKILLLSLQNTKWVSTILIEFIKLFGRPNLNILPLLLHFNWAGPSGEDQGRAGGLPLPLSVNF